jgi:hypothetical protein
VFWLLDRSTDEVGITDRRLAYQRRAALAHEADKRPPRKRKPNQPAGAADRADGLTGAITFASCASGR